VAAGIDPGPTNAFCVFVGWPEVPEGNLPHEIGHLYGALHQNSSASTPYAFGHAFEYTDGLGVTKGTIMRSGIPWIDYLSSPNITYDGRVIGTASWRDVARLTRGRLDGTLNYYSYTPSSIQDYRQTQATVSLTSETVQAKEVRLAIATSSITIGSGYTVQNGARFTARVNGSAIGKRNAPAPANQDPTEAVAVPADLTLRISTAGGAMQLHYAVPARSKVQVHIFNAAGRHMLSEFLGTLDAGTYVRSLPMELLAAGSYYLSIEAGELRSNATFVKR